MRRTTFTVVTVLLAIAFTTSLAGTAAADNHAFHDASIETDSLTSGANETIAVTITNEEDDNMVSPLIEIPLRSGLSILEANRTMDDGREFIVTADGNNAATVESDAGLDQRRSAYIDSSTIRGGDAVFIEGVEVPAGETRTYSVPIHISGTSSITIEADTRPLNNEGQNNKVQNSIEPVVTGTVSVQADNEVTITGANTNIEKTVAGADKLDLPGNETYNISTTLSDPIGDLSVDDVQLDEFETQPIKFNDPSPDGTLSPAVVATTNGQADVVEGSRSRETSIGTAEEATTQTVTFDLSANGGQTVVAVGTQSDLPMDSITGVTGATNRPFDGDIAQLETDGAVDDTVSVSFEGRKLGDVDNDDTVNSDDAVEIAETIAADNGESLTAYADVTNSDSVSAIDTMQIQQYAEGNRTADYAINGGS
jgi:hypothetical protein